VRTIYPPAKIDLFLKTDFWALILYDTNSSAVKLVESVNVENYRKSSTINYEFDKKSILTWKGYKTLFCLWQHK